MSLRNPYRVLVALLVLVLAPLAGAQPKNVILLIGDGMGTGHVQAASWYAYGREGALFMEKLPAKAEVSTTPADGRSIPDSASGGTALATGVKVNPGVLSQAGGKDLPTILEKYAADGKSTGLVTSESLGGATPAAFSAHTPSRKNYAEIYRSYYEKNRPNLLLGGGWQQPEEDATKAGYKIVRTRAELFAVDPAKTSHVAGRFSPASMPVEFDYRIRADGRYDRIPHLSEMAAASLEFLASNDKGFFLMIEGGLIDHAAHRNDLVRTIYETLEFDTTVREVLRWAAGRNDTLVIVTADHETGGLAVTKGGRAGELPEVTWSTGGHTKSRLPLYAWGVGAEKFTGQIENTDVPNTILKLSIRRSSGSI